MTTYRVDAMDSTGLEVSQDIEANTREAAAHAMRKAGFFVTRIRLINPAAEAFVKKHAKGRKMTTPEILSVTKALGVAPVMYDGDRRPVVDNGPMIEKMSKSLDKVINERFGKPERPQTVVEVKYDTASLVVISIWFVAGIAVGFFVGVLFA